MDEFDLDFSAVDIKELREWEAAYAEFALEDYSMNYTSDDSY